MMILVVFSDLSQALLLTLANCRIAAYSTVQLHILRHSGAAAHSLVETVSKRSPAAERAHNRTATTQVNSVLYLSGATRRQLKASTCPALHIQPPTLCQGTRINPSRGWDEAVADCVNASGISIHDGPLPEGVGVVTRLGYLQDHWPSAKQKRLRRLRESQRPLQRPSSAPPEAPGCYVRSNQQSVLSILHDLNVPEPPTDKALYNFPRFVSRAASVRYVPCEQACEGTETRAAVVAGDKPSRCLRPLAAASASEIASLPATGSCCLRDNIGKRARPGTWWARIRSMLPPSIWASLRMQACRERLVCPSSVTSTSALPTAGPRLMAERVLKLRGK